jgi:very-short-patch-repair endonuclease
MKERRRELRKDMTAAEKALWQMIRNEQLGVKFRRQHSYDHYVIDFYCPALSLAIEVDGSSHLEDGAQLRDSIRQRYLESKGLRFVRVTDPEVMHDATTALRRIKEAIEKYRAHPNLTFGRKL